MVHSRIPFITSVTLAVFVFATISGYFVYAGDDTFQMAKRAYQEDRYEEALALLVRFIDQNESNPARHEELSQAYYMKAQIYKSWGVKKKYRENMQKMDELLKRDVRRKVEGKKAERSPATKQETQAKKTRKRKKKADQQVIEVEARKRPRQKFPWLLAAAGVAGLGLLITLFLVSKKSGGDNGGDYDLEDEFNNLDENNWEVITTGDGYHAIDNGEIVLHTGFNGKCYLFSKKIYRLSSENVIMTVRIKSNFAGYQYGNEFNIGLRNQHNSHQQMIELNRQHEPWYGPNLYGFNEYRLVTRKINNYHYTPAILASYEEFLEIQFECSQTSVKLYINGELKSESTQYITTEPIRPCFIASNAFQTGDRTLTIDWVRVEREPLN